jgi:hypothetical protein
MIVGPPGHFGITLAAKPLIPTVPLWTLLVASEALDLLSFGFISIGLERMAVSKINFQDGIQTITPGSVPWSHGLFTSLVWSAIFATVTYLILRNWKAGMIVGLVTFSHWILDFIVHPPDLPIFLRDLPELGLGLWTSGPGFIISIILEFVLLTGGLAIYWVARKRRKSQETTPSAI